MESVEVGEMAKEVLKLEILVVLVKDEVVLST